MEKLLKELNITEDKTTKLKASKKVKFDTVKENTTPVADYHFMADLLMMPTDKKGYRYALVVVDLWSQDFDIEKLKTKESKEVLLAYKKMIKRKYIKMPEGSMQTDKGTEFSSVFSTFLFDNEVMHKRTFPDRHKQNSVVERLNRELGKVFNLYMNSMQKKTKKVYREWTDIIDKVREKYNEIKPKRKDENPYAFKDESEQININWDSKFKKNDLVYVKYEVPHDNLGHKLSGNNFREGDMKFDLKNPKKILRLVHYKNNTRYLISGHKNVSYTEDELILAEDEKDEKFEIKKIIGEKTEKKIKYYLVWWKGYLKKDASWEPRKNLIDDGIDNVLDIIEKNKKKK